MIQLLEATYRNLLGKNYVIDPALSADARVITLNVKDVPMEDVQRTVDALLLENGITSKSIAGIQYFFRQVPGNTVQSSTPLGAVSSDRLLPPPLPAQSYSMPAGMSGELRIYRPKARPASQLQQLANLVLGTSLQAQDVVLLSGSRREMDKAQRLLLEYDKPAGEVIAKALVLEFADSSQDATGFQIALSALSTNLTAVVGGPIKLLDNFIRIKDTSIDAVLSALRGDSRFKLVSTPTLRVKDGAKGRVTVGQDVPVLSEAQLDKNGNPIQSIQYRPSGVIFDIAPRVMSERIELDLTQQISNFQATSSSAINSPTLTKRELSTTVTVEPGDIIVLGGLDESKDTQARQGLSFLPRILDSRKADSTKTQILVVLQVTTPQVDNAQPN